MILTCPECATSYFVDDGVIPDAGRTVKCASCHAKWKAFPNADAVAVVGVAAPPPATESAPAFDAEIVSAEDPPVAAADDDDLEIVAAPRPMRRATDRKRGRTGLYAGLAAAAVVVAALGAGVFFRQKVVELWPATAQVYAAVGLPVDRLGLVIEQVKFQPSFQGGRPVLSVTGAIRNTRHAAAEAPSLRVSLLDKDGHPLAAKLARPLNPRIPPGAVRYFAVALPDPPAGLQALEVVFEEGAVHAAPAKGGHGGGEAAHDTHAEAVIAPEPVEAKPLPADSEHALPDQHG